MKIVEENMVKEYFDGTAIVEYRLKSAVSDDCIYKIGSLGKLDYYKSFPKKYFSVLLANGSEIRGAEGETTVQVVYGTESKRDYKSVLEQFIENDMDK